MKIKKTIFGHDRFFCAKNIIRYNDIGFFYFTAMLEDWLTLMNHEFSVTLFAEIIKTWKSDRNWCSMVKFVQKSRGGNSSCVSAIGYEQEIPKAKGRFQCESTCNGVQFFDKFEADISIFAIMSTAINR